MDEVFKALADPSRRALLDRLSTSPGLTLSQLCEGLEMSRQAVSKHLGVLEVANLVVTVKHGREKLHYLNAAPIAELSDRWIHRYVRRRVRALADLKHTIEEEPMTQPEFVYVAYIRATPEQVFEGLTDPAFTSQYWGMDFTSTWKAGDPYAVDMLGVHVEDPGMVILECDPPRHLSYTWHAFTEELGAAIGFEPAFLARAAAEPKSRVSFDLVAVGDTVRLTVCHDQFAPDSVVLESVSGGWPQVISNLKSLLETGKAQPLTGDPEARAARR
jgi:uncharacterized protein YndB with AHSA1/START domain/DNA-binding transcriptional ArsR family regulator